MSRLCPICGHDMAEYDEGEVVCGACQDAYPDMNLDGMTALEVRAMWKSVKPKVVKP